MLTLHGTVMNVFTTPKGVNRDSGEEYGGSSKVQVMAENILKNGDKRMDMINLTTNEPDVFKPFVGKFADIPVSVFVINGALMFMMPPGAKPIPPRSDLGRSKSS
jgi:hypothetical protein